MTDADRRDELPRFGPLADYRAPSMPTRDALHIMITRARELLRREPTQPTVAETRLRRSTLEMLEEAAPSPAFGPVLAELQSSLVDWLAEAEPAERTRLIVLPPGDYERLMARWAKQNGYATLQAPDRAQIVGASTDDLVDPAGEGVLVIPALEDWFVRHREGLTLVRALLDRLARIDRKVVVGCNSWAWLYLVRAVRADVVLSAPIIFQPFDAERLRRWFTTISGDAAHDPIRFLAARSGDDVLALDDNDQPHDALVSLAARSQGIPWVAWRLWRSSLRRRIPESESAEAADQDADGAHFKKNSNNDARTLWTITVAEYSLPGRNADDSRLVLQALLIHGPLHPDRLSDVLPFTGVGDGVATMLNAGIIERHDDGRLACAPAAYPTVRTGLATAGFPLATV